MYALLTAPSSRSRLLLGEHLQSNLHQLRDKPRAHCARDTSFLFAMEPDGCILILCTHPMEEKKLLVASVIGPAAEAK